MNPLLLLGLGAGFLILSGSSKSSSKKDESKKTSSEGKLPTQGNIKSGQTSSIPKPKDLVCSNYELKKDDKCIAFWNDAIKKKVTDKIIGKAYEFMKTPYIGSVPLPREGTIGEDYIPLLCLRLNGKMNPNAERIIMETILETWGDIKKIDLPPKSNASLWVKIVWDEVVKIYDKEICIGKGV